MSIVIVCWPLSDIINFEINIIFLILQFFLRDQKARQKFKYLEKEKSLWVEIKSIFYHFQRAFIEANKTTFLEGESLTLKFYKYYCLILKKMIHQVEIQSLYLC